MRGPKFIIGIGVLLVVLIGGWFFFFGPGRQWFGAGRDAAEQWVGVQILAIANHFLNPELTFDRLQYRYPGTVLLHNVTLTAEDETFVTTDLMRIQLTDRPRIGQPIVIESVSLKSPQVKLIQKEGGELLGFRNFLRTTEGRRLDDGGSTRPSDIFAIRTISIDDGAVEYFTHGSDEIMRLDELTFDLNSNPEADPGWYTIEATVQRTPFFEVDLDARYNLDTRMTDISAVKLAMDLQRDQYDRLPPQLQRLFEQYEIAGDFRAAASGSGPLGNFAAEGSLTMAIELTDGFIAGEELMLPLESLTIDAVMSEGVLTIDMLRAHALNGVLELTGDASLTDQRDADLALRIDGMQIEDAVRELGDGPPRYAGRVDLDATLTAQLNAWRESLDGNGTLRVRDGRMINMPVIGDLVEVVGGRWGEQRDRADADLVLNGERMRFSNIEMVSASVAARGDGVLFFDQRIDFRMNAGPLERLQDELGEVGRIFGSLTDKLVTYHITGTLSEPQVKVRPLGLGMRGQSSPIEEH